MPAAEGPPEDCCQQHKQRTGEGAMLLILEKLVVMASSYELSCSHPGGAQDLAVTEDGCDSLWGSSGPYAEHHFLALEGKMVCCSILWRSSSHWLPGMN